MSTKYLLAAFGLALAKAAEVLIEHSEKFDADDNYIGDEEGSTVTPIQSLPPQTTPQQIANAELDADGLPWDARIHASTKTKTQKKQWTRKKGVGDDVHEAVVGELRKLYPAAQTVIPTATVTAPTVPTISLAVAAPATPYAQLTDWLARNTGEGKQLTSAWVNEQFAANGTSLPALATNQELAGEWLKQFRDIGKQIGLPE